MFGSPENDHARRKKRENRALGVVLLILAVLVLWLVPLILVGTGSSAPQSASPTPRMTPVYMPWTPVLLPMPEDLDSPATTPTEPAMLRFDDAENPALDQEGVVSAPSE